MGTLFILYQIDLDVYKSVRERNYQNYSRPQMVQNMLWGSLVIDNDQNNIFLPEVDLLNFFIMLEDNLNDIKTKGKGDIFSVYDGYHLSLKLYNENMVKIIFNKKEELIFDLKRLLKKIQQIKDRLFKDFKILYPDYLRMKQIDFLIEKMEPKTY